MGALGTTKGKRSTASKKEPPAGFASAEEFRKVLDELFSDVDADPNAGPQLRAVHVPQRFIFPDVNLVLNVGPVEEDKGDHCLRWKFDDRIDWKPAFTLEMDSDVANRYLQGRENLAIAIARGRIRASTNARAAISFLPVSKALIVHYTRIVERSYPQLKVS
jgi:hypothetical protein